MLGKIFTILDLCKKYQLSSRCPQSRFSKTTSPSRHDVDDDDDEEKVEEENEVVKIPANQMKQKDRRFGVVNVWSRLLAN